MSKTKTSYLGEQQQRRRKSRYVTWQAASIRVIWDLDSFQVSSANQTENRQTRKETTTTTNRQTTLTATTTNKRLRRRRTTSTLALVAAAAEAAAPANRVGALEANQRVAI